MDVYYVRDSKATCGPFFDSANFSLAAAFKFGDVFDEIYSMSEPFGLVVTFVLSVAQVFECAPDWNGSSMIWTLTVSV